MSADRVRLSLNEVETTTLKALIGTGTDPGTAAEVAAAVRWFCERGEDGVASVLMAIRGSDDLAATVRAVDAVITGEGASVTVDRNVVLLAALCGPAAEVFGLRFELTATDWSAAIGAGELTGSIGSGPVSVRSVAAGASAGAAVTAQLVVDQADWHALGVLAARIYVPSSERSRASGAGAGLTDND